MYTYNTDYYASSSVNGIFVWTIIAAVIAIIGGITLYFIFLKGNQKLNKFLTKLRDFLNFKILLIEDILKITYLILAIFITLYSFGLIGINFGLFLLTLILGNLGLRISYELSILLINICRNTSDINNKLEKNSKH